jgi:flagellar motor switch protein FliN/FliY
MPQSPDQADPLAPAAAPSTPPHSATPKPTSGEEPVSLHPSEIEELLKRSESDPQGTGRTRPSQTPSGPIFDPYSATEPRPGSRQGTLHDRPELNPDDLEYLLQQAEQAIASVETPPADVPQGMQRFELKHLAGSPPSSDAATVGLMSDVELDLTVELGRTLMPLEDVLKLRKGAVVPLDKLAGDPVDIFANGRRIARGEVLVLNDNFCIRVAELVEGDAPGN